MKKQELTNIKLQSTSHIPQNQIEFWQQMYFQEFSYTKEDLERLIKWIKAEEKIKNYRKN